MGWIEHDAIIVTDHGIVNVATTDDALRAAHAYAKSFSHLPVSEIIHSPVNGYNSFFIAPTGSKRGWEDEEIGNQQRGKFIEWLVDMQAGGDWRYHFDWVVIRYGADFPRGAEITAHNKDHL